MLNMCKVSLQVFVNDYAEEKRIWIHSFLLNYRTLSAYLCVRILCKYTYQGFVSLLQFIFQYYCCDKMTTCTISNKFWCLSYWVGLLVCLLWLVVVVCFFSAYFGCMLADPCICIISFNVSSNVREPVQKTPNCEACLFLFIDLFI